MINHKVDVLKMTNNSVEVNEIVDQIRDLINYKNFEPGDRLPSERMLSAKFGVSRFDIREAIKKLDFYGLLNSIPKKGAFVSDIGIVALNGVIDNILKLKKPNLISIIEVRIFLELKTVSLAAINRTEEDLEELANSLKVYKDKVLTEGMAIQEDLLFHLAIAKASGNGSLNNALLHIVPDIISNFEKHLVCNSQQAISGIKDHTDIFNAIKNQDSDLATQVMKVHFKSLYNY